VCQLCAKSSPTLAGLSGKATYQQKRYIIYEKPKAATSTETSFDRFSFVEMQPTSFNTLYLVSLQSSKDDDDGKSDGRR
jgi:hypothetical protein